MKKSFPGFPQEMFQFLQELVSNNNRDWFNENKERYRNVVVTPVIDFIDAMRPRMEAISPHYVVDSRPHGGSMFRIYRDTRFSKNKQPYKEHVGCQFRHEAGKDAHAPGFYVHLATDEILFGGGVWNPAITSLTATRVQALAIDPVTRTTLYAGTGDGGVFKSTDGGGVWSAANTSLK